MPRMVFSMACWYLTDPHCEGGGRQNWRVERRVFFLEGEIQVFSQGRKGVGVFSGILGLLRYCWPKCLLPRISRHKLLWKWTVLLTSAQNTRFGLNYVLNAFLYRWHHAQSTAVQAKVTRPQMITTFKINRNLWIECRIKVFHRWCAK